MSAPAANGHLSAVESNPLDAQIDQLEAQLEAMLAPLHERRAELEVELLELATQEERIGNALRALHGKGPITNGAPQRRAPRTPRAPGERDSNAWTPSVEVIERVFAGLKTRNVPASVTELAEQVDTSRDTVSRSLKVLRDEGRARLVGRAGRGNAHVYLPMEAEA